MKRVWFSALGALTILATATAVVSSPASAAEAASSGRLQQAESRLADRWAAAPESSEPTVSAAEVRTSSDSSTDAPNCGGDLTSFGVNYGTSTVDLSATTQCPTDPATNNHWNPGYTVLIWAFDHDNDGEVDYLAGYFNDGDSVTAQMLRLSDEVTTCEVVGTYDGTTYRASFVPSCFGSPTRTYAGVLIIWDEALTGDPSCQTCPVDAAPETNLLGPIYKGTPPAPGTGASGYWMLGEGGKVYAFGAARHYGDADVAQTGSAAVDIESRPNDNAGYWVLDNNGHVFAFGSAPWHGNATGQLQAGEQAASIAGTKTGKGYYVFTDRGRAIKFGDAVHRGDMNGVPLNGPVLDSTLTGAGTGYYMVGSDGGIFSFNAAFYAPMGGQPLNQPVNGMAGDPDNVGYWLVASDGGIFAFSAAFRGSMGGQTLNRPVVGMVAYGNGYLMVASDGGIFNFSSKAFVGSLGSNPPTVPITSVAPIR